MSLPFTWSDRDENRFWSRVSIPRDVMTDCWLWTGRRNERGYGTIRIHGRAYYAHRICFPLVADVELGDLCVLHRCDVTSCVNPAHLFLGTRRENALDRDAKGRGFQPGPINPLRGEAIANSKLSPQSVAEIRSLLGSGVPQSAIARRYGVAQMTISDINCGKTWRHVHAG